MELNTIPMNVISMQDLKVKGAKALDENDHNFLTVNSKMRFAILAIEEYKRLIEAIEDLEDIRDADARIDEETIPAEEVYKKLGI